MQICVKTATDSPANGRTVEKTTVTRVIPTDFTQERKVVDFWDYLESLPATWGSPPDRHLLYIYRRLSDSGPNPQIEKCSGCLYMPDGSSVILNDREEVEHAIGKKHGGGTYRLILKNGSERVSEGRIVVEGAPKLPPPMPATAPVAQPGSPGDPGDVAKTAMQLVGNRDAEAVNVAISALRGASDVVQRFSQNGNGAGMNEMLMQAMIQRLLQPPADPIESLAKVIAVFQTLTSAMNPAAAQNPTLAKILDSAVERLINPLPSGPATSTGAELVRQLPQVAGYVTEAIREWRVGTEAQLHTAQIMATQRPPQLPAGTVQQPAPGQPVRPITQATQISQTPPPGELPMPVRSSAGDGAPSLEFIEAKIVEILQKAIPTDEAADEVLAFLDLMAPTMVDQLSQLEESQLMQLFQGRPVLRQYRDLARLQEFVRAFLKYSKPEPAPGVDTSSKPN